MKILALSVVVVAVLVVGGCADPYKESEVQREVNQRLVTWYSDAAINNALISQRTVFPYHFVDQTAALNALGQRDVGILAAHFKEYPGSLNVRRGAAEDSLYQGRVDAVRQVLIDAGVDQARIELREGLAGGEGMPSEQVLVILEEGKDKPKASTSYTYTQTSR